MPATTTAKNFMLDALAATAVFVSLHSDWPGETGANELSGGTPAYARQAETWNPASGGNLDNLLAPTFNVPAGTTVSWIGVWTLVTGGSFLWSVPLGATAAAVPFTAEDSTDVLTADQHGLANGDRVVLFDTEGAVIPAGTTEGTPIYFVRDVTTDTFKVALTSGGTAVDLTVDGAGFAQRCVPETFGGQGTLTVSDLDLGLNR